MRRSIPALLLLSLIGCSPEVPEIGRGLPSNYAEGEQVFDARIKERFPAGTEEGVLVDELTRQGFSIVSTPDGQFATFSNGAFPVETVWHVNWETTDGRISEAWGIYGGRGP